MHAGLALYHRAWSPALINFSKPWCPHGEECEIIDSSSLSWYRIKCNMLIKRSVKDGDCPPYYWTRGSKWRYWLCEIVWEIWGWVGREPSCPSSYSAKMLGLSFFCGTGVWTQDLTLLGRHSTWSHSTSPGAELQSSAFLIAHSYSTRCLAHSKHLLSSC
jgi:hypothetical protein